MMCILRLLFTTGCSYRFHSKLTMRQPVYPQVYPWPQRSKHKLHIHMTTEVVQGMTIGE